MITSLTEMLELPNLDHMTKSTYLSHVKNFLLVTSWTEIMMSQPLLQNTFVLRKARVDNVANIIKIPTTFLKEDSKKVKRIRNYVLTNNLYMYFLI